MPPEIKAASLAPAICFYPASVQGFPRPAAGTTGNISTLARITGWNNPRRDAKTGAGCWNLLHMKARYLPQLRCRPTGSKPQGPPALSIWRYFTAPGDTDLAAVRDQASHQSGQSEKRQFA